MYVSFKHDFTQRESLLKLPRLFIQITNKCLQIVVANVVLEAVIASNRIFQIFAVCTGFCQKWRR